MPLESIVGREREVEEIIALLRATRLVTITGLGGTGKSRLAFEVARRWDAGAGRVAVVALSAVNEAGFVAPQIARSIGVPAVPGADPEALVARGLAAWTGLLVLDDMEDVLEIAPVLRAWLAQSPGVAVLATSRVPLGIAAEQVYRLSPLELPASGRLEDVERSPAAILFLREARRLGSMGELHAQDAVAVQAICQRLSGIPLALELAAARTTLLPPSAIARRLSEGRVSGGAGALDAALTWTLDLLGEDDRRRLLDLAVVPGAFDLEIAEALWAGADPIETLERLARLALIRRAPGDMERWEILEPVRDFLLDRLRSAGGLDDATRRLAAFVAGFVPLAQGSSAMPVGAWMATIHERHELVRAALDWQADRDPEGAVDIIVGLATYWLWSPWSREGRDRARALAAIPDLPMPARVRILETLARLELQARGPDHALPYAMQAAELARDLGDAKLLLPAILTVARVHGEQDAFDLEWPELEEALRLARQVDDRRTEILVLNNQALHFLERGRLDACRERADAALRAGRRLGDDPAAAQALFALAEVASLQGHHAEAVRHADAAFQLCRALGPGPFSARIAASRLRTVLAAGLIDVAVAALEDAVPLAEAADAWGETGAVLDGAAWLLLEQDRPAEAARLLGMADGVRRDANVESQPDPRLAAQVRRLRQLLDGPTIDRLMREGAQGDVRATMRSLTVIVRAGVAARARRVEGRYGTLSRREREVLGLVAHGATDSAIGDALGIAAKTASVHVSNIKGKLGVETRIDLAIEGRRLLDDLGPG
jgi:predicted ATPase/DNA-binding NarL/FixJ family response regulator